MPEPEPQNRNPQGRPNAARRLEIAQRRVEVAERVMRHEEYRDIARDLGIGLGRVGDDVKQIKRMWAERSAAAWQYRVAEEDAKLDALEKVYLRRALEGFEESAALVLRIMERRAKLLGLDQPTRIEAAFTVTDYQTKVDGELEEMLAVGGAELALDVESHVREG